MSTAQKLSYLNETKTQLKDTINLTGANLTNDTFRSYPSKLYKKLLDAVVDSEELYENLPKVNGTGTDITLNNTDECKIKFNMLGGNTEQEENPTPDNPKEIRNAGVESYSLIDFNNIDGITIADMKYSFKNDILNVKSTTNTYRNISWNITDLFKANTGKPLRFCYTDIDISKQYGSIAQLSIYYNDDTPTSQQGLLFHNLTKPNYTIPDDISNVREVWFRIYSNNSSTSQEASVTIKEPILIFSTEDKPYIPYGYFANVEVRNKNYNYNLYEHTSKTEKGITWTINDDGTILVDGSNTSGSTAYFNLHYLTPIFLKAGTYTASFGSISNVRGTIARGDNHNVVITPIPATTGKITFTINEDLYVTFVLAVDNNKSVDNVLIKPMIEKGEEATTYVEGKTQTKRIDLNIYDNVGNVIGHNELCKIGDYRDYFRKSTGKNKLNIREGTYTASNELTAVVKNNVITINGTATATRFIAISLNTNLTMENDKQYTVSAFNNVANSNVRIRIDSNGILDTTLNNINTTKTITFNNNNLFGNQISIRVESGTTLSNYKITPMIEEGNTTTTTYEPYGTNWYYKKEVNKIVLDGSNDENWTLNGENTNYGQYKYITTDKALGKFNLISNKFITEFTNNENCVAGRDVNTNIYLTIEKNLVSYTITDLRTWLSTNNVEVQYVLDTPTYEIITNENVINSLEFIVKSYEDKTHIISVDDVPMYLDVSAVRKYEE